MRLAPAARITAQRSLDRSIGPKTGLIVPFLGPITAIMKNSKPSDALFTVNRYQVRCLCNHYSIDGRRPKEDLKFLSTPSSHTGKFINDQLRW